MGFVEDEVALVQVFSEYFGFPCQFSFHRLLNIHHQLSSGAGTVGQTVAGVPSGLKYHPTKDNKENERHQLTYYIALCSGIKNIIILVLFLKV
jgi:hypothetical protein